MSSFQAGWLTDNIITSVRPAATRGWVWSFCQVDRMVFSIDIRYFENISHFWVSGCHYFPTYVIFMIMFFLLKNIKKNRLFE